MKIDLVYFHGSDSYELTFQPSDKRTGPGKEVTFMIPNDDHLSLLISALEMARDNYGGEEWELHVGFRRDDPPE